MVSKLLGIIPVQDKKNPFFPLCLDGSSHNTKLKETKLNTKPKWYQL